MNILFILLFTIEFFQFKFCLSAALIRFSNDNDEKTPEGYINMQLQAFELNSCSLFIIRTIPNKNPPIHKYNKHINERGDGSDIVCVIVPNQKKLLWIQWSARAVEME